MPSGGSCCGASTRTFYHQTVTTGQVVDYFNQQTGQNLTPIFDQYLRHPGLPVLEVRFPDSGPPLARWIAAVPGFELPARLRVRGTAGFVPFPLTTTFQPVNLPWTEQRQAWK